MNFRGTLAKMIARHEDPVSYDLPVGEARVALNDLVQSRVELVFSGDIYCIGCGRKTRKSFNQGYCYPCFRSKAVCDRCIMQSALCHYHLGTCREPAWGEAHCMRPHVVYVANSSGPKVGITRASQVPARWIDQGAIQAMPVFDVANRYHSGLVEAVLKQSLNDRTNWRAMLMGDTERIDLSAFWRDLCRNRGLNADAIRDASGADSVADSSDRAVREFRYPVAVHPRTVRSIDPAVTPRIEATLLGVKGQYLIFDDGVINVRRYAGYEVAFRS